VSIDEIMNNVTLIRSDLSRFSRGTVLTFFLLFMVSVPSLGMSLTIRCSLKK
jgi:hypothetical protein